MKKINLGKLGETDFVRWSTQAGLITNSSNEEDVAGWDYLVEFPIEHCESVPKDRIELPLECKVQVKATQRQDKRLGIKLSVLQRLISYSYPAFILFLEYNNDTSPTIENAYLIHIDEKIIKRTLKKIRENDLLDKPKELHKLKISISYNTNDQFKHLNGDTLKLLIKKHSGKSIETYQNEKQSLRKNLGYEDGGIIMTCTFNKDKFNKQHFIDMSLGLRESVEVDKVIVKDERFNIKNDKFIMSELESSRLTIQNENAKDCKIRIKTSKYSPAIIFDAELISLSINPILNNNEKVILLKTALFTFVFEGLKTGTNKVKIRFTLDRLCEIQDVLSMIKVFSCSEERLLLEVVGLHENTMKFDIDINTSNPYKPEFAQSLENIINTFEIKRSNETYFHQIISQKDNIIFVNDLLKNDIKNGFIDTNEIIPGNPNNFIFLEGMFVNLGVSIVGGIFGLHAKSESSTRFKIEKVELLQPICSYESISDQDLASLYEDCKLRFDKDDILLVTRS